MLNMKFQKIGIAPGFVMLEPGLVRSKNAATICLKNIVLYSLAGLMFYLIGYSLMYTDVSGFIGTLGGIFYSSSESELVLLGAVGSGGEIPVTAEMTALVADSGYSVMSDWFFSNGVCGHNSLHRFRDLGGTYQILALYDLYHCFDRLHLPDSGGLDMGRRLPR